MRRILLAVGLLLPHSRSQPCPNGGGPAVVRRATRQKASIQNRSRPAPPDDLEEKVGQMTNNSSTT